MKQTIEWTGSNLFGEDIYTTDGGLKKPHLTKQSVKYILRTLSSKEPDIVKNNFAYKTIVVRSPEGDRTEHLVLGKVV